MIEQAKVRAVCYTVERCTPATCMLTGIRCTVREAPLAQTVHPGHCQLLDIRRRPSGGFRQRWPGLMQWASSSSNEEVDDIATADIKYLLLPYMQGFLLSETPGRRSPQKRRCQLWKMPALSPDAGTPTHAPDGKQSMRMYLLTFALTALGHWHLRLLDVDAIGLSAYICAVRNLSHGHVLWISKPIPRTQLMFDAVDTPLAGIHA